MIRTIVVVFCWPWKAAVGLAAQPSDPRESKLLVLERLWK